MIGKQIPIHSFLVGFALIALVLGTGPVASAVDSTSSNRAAFQAFTSAPAQTTQLALLQYFSGQEIHPIIDRTPEFEQMVRSGHPLALEVAFESLPYTDGAEGLHLSGLIGKSILSAPEAFLGAVTTYRPTIDHLSALGSLLGYLGEEYVDDLPATIRGLEDRYLALRDVDAPDHDEVRDEVLLLLSETIHKRRKNMKEISTASTKDGSHAPVLE